jgi:hypothetical protein
MPPVLPLRIFLHARYTFYSDGSDVEMRLFYLVLSCLIHPQAGRTLRGGGGGAVLPHHPNICSEEPWQAPVSGLASPEFGFPLSPTTSHTSSHTSHYLSPTPTVSCGFCEHPLGRGLLRQPRLARVEARGPARSGAQGCPAVRLQCSPGRQQGTSPPHCLRTASASEAASHTLRYH